MGIRDNDIEWMRKRIYIPSQHFTGLLGILRTGSTATAALANGALLEDPSLAETAVRLSTSTVDTSFKVALMAGLADGVPAVDVISTFEVGALRMDTNGDSVTHRMRIPVDVDPEFAMGFRINWTSGSSTTADTVSFIGLLDFKAEGVALAAPTTVLDTAIALLDTVTGAWHNQWTARGVKNAYFLTREQIEAGAHMLMNIEMDAKAVGLTEALFCLGLEIDYVPNKTVGPGTQSERPRTRVGV